MNSNSQRTTLFCALLLPLAIGCATVHDTLSSSPTEVPDGLLQYASKSDLDEVQEARAAHHQALDRLAAARTNEERADDQNKVLREQIALTEQRVDVESARIEARAKGETAELEEAEAQKIEAEKRVEAARRDLEVNARRVKVRQAEVAVAEAEVRLAERHVELAKARAVAPLDRPQAKEFDVRQFEAAVRERETELELAKVQQDAAQREFEIFEKNTQDRMESNRAPADRDRAKRDPVVRD